MPIGGFWVIGCTAHLGREPHATALKPSLGEHSGGGSVKVRRACFFS
jgi:hypothetical protein